MIATAGRFEDEAAAIHAALVAAVTAIRSGDPEAAYGACLMLRDELEGGAESARSLVARYARQLRAQ